MLAIKPKTFKHTLQKQGCKNYRLRCFFVVGTQAVVFMAFMFFNHNNNNNNNNHQSGLGPHMFFFLQGTLEAQLEVLQLHRHFAPFFKLKIHVVFLQLVVFYIGNCYMKWKLVLVYILSFPGVQ